MSALLVAATVTAYGSSSLFAAASSARSSSSRPAGCVGQTLSFQLSFFPNAQHAGFLVAETRGYYRAQGLNVNIIPGGPATPKGLSVTAGTVDIGMLDFSEFATAYAHGAPVTWISLLYRADPQIYVSLKTAGITQPSDLRGKTFGISDPDDPDKPDLLGILQQGGVPESTLHFIPVAPARTTANDLTSGKVAIQIIQRYFNVAELKDAGLWPNKVNVLDPNKLGTAVAISGLEVNNSYLKTNRAAVVCFLRASIEGWRYAIAHPAAAAKEVMDYIPAGLSNLKDQTTDTEETDSLVDPAGMPANQVMGVDMPFLQLSVRKFVQYHALSKAINLSKGVDGSLVQQAEQGSYSAK